MLLSFFLYFIKLRFTYCKKKGKEKKLEKTKTDRGYFIKFVLVCVLVFKSRRFLKPFRLRAYGFGTSNPTTSHLGKLKIKVRNLNTPIM